MPITASLIREKNGITISSQQWEYGQIKLCCICTKMYYMGIKMILILTWEDVHNVYLGAKHTLQRT